MIREAERVLMHYPDIEPHIEFIRHNENMTYKVTNQLDKKSYLLRIHKPISEGFSGIQHTLNGLMSEIMFLRKIEQQNILKVQKPVMNRDGAFVTAYSSEQFGHTFATLLEWIEGTTLNLEADNIVQIIYKLGENVAALHQFSQTQQHLKIDRPVYDGTKVDSTILELRKGAANGVLNHEDVEIIEAVLSIVKTQMQQLDIRNNASGLIHADYQLGNIIVNEANPSLIDFCLFGYGYYLFDLASACSMLKSNLRKTFLEGYASKAHFSFDDIRYIEGQIFMDIFISYLYFIDDAERNGWIKEHAAKICSSHCVNFIAEKEVLYAF